ncbi:MAG: hypothetical protein ACREJM_12515, partial [Candidatus Saccharimonadales bacterium]
MTLWNNNELKATRRAFLERGASAERSLVSLSVTARSDYSSIYRPTPYLSNALPSEQGNRRPMGSYRIGDFNAKRLKGTSTVASEARNSGLPQVGG